MPDVKPEDVQTEIHHAPEVCDDPECRWADNPGHKHERIEIHHSTWEAMSKMQDRIAQLTEERDTNLQGFNDMLAVWKESQAQVAQLTEERDEIRRGWQLQTAEWAEHRTAWHKANRQLQREQDEAIARADRAEAALRRIANDTGGMDLGVGPNRTEMQRIARAALADSPGERDD